MPHFAYVSPDTYCLLILGNDIFNREVVEIIGENDSYGALSIRYKDTLDVMPLKRSLWKKEQGGSRHLRQLG